MIPCCFYNVMQIQESRKFWEIDLVKTMIIQCWLVLQLNWCLQKKYSMTIPTILDFYQYRQIRSGTSTFDSPDLSNLELQFSIIKLGSGVFKQETWPFVWCKHEIRLVSPKYDMYYILCIYYYVWEIRAKNHFNESEWIAKLFQNWHLKCVLICS